MSLPDDLVLEILARVKDIVALFRCATACKGWCRLLLSDAANLRRCLPEEACRSSPFTGFFTQQQRRRRRDLPAPCFVPGPRPVLGARGVLSSLVPGMGDLAVPLTSRHGLLLVRVGDLLIVCDPLAGTFKPLPPLGYHWGSQGFLTGYAMLTAADCPSTEHDDEFPFFKVMIIAVAKFPMYYDLYTYSSAGESAGWHTCSGNAGAAGDDIHVTLLQHNAVVCHGNAYWFFRGTSATYNAECIIGIETGTIKLVNPRLCSLLCDPAYDEPYLGVDSVGMIALFFLRVDGTQLDIYNGTDLQIKLKPPSQLEHTCLGEKNGTLIIKDDHQRIYVASVNTGLMQEITDFPRGHVLERSEIVPLEMDWPALFISRLGAVATA